MSSKGVSKQQREEQRKRALEAKLAKKKTSAYKRNTEANKRKRIEREERRQKRCTIRREIRILEKRPKRGAMRKRRREAWMRSSTIKQGKRVPSFERFTAIRSGKARTHLRRGGLARLSSLVRQ